MAIPNKKKGDPNLDNQKVFVMLLIDAYADRMKPENWKKEEEFSVAQSDLEEMTLAEFCNHHNVLSKGVNQNKIEIYKATGKTRGRYCRFLPKIKTDRDGDDFPRYCKYTLMKYKPWHENVNTLWEDEEEPSDELLVLKYDEFIAELAEKDINPPDALQMAVKNFKSLSRNAQREIQEVMCNGDDIPMNNEDIEEDAQQNAWMEVASRLGIDPCTLDDGEDKCEIAWDLDYDPTNVEHSYEGRYKPVDDVSKVWKEQVLEAESNLEGIEAPTTTLKPLQKKAVFLVKDLIRTNEEKKKKVNGNKNGDLCMLMGVGGTGKTETLKHIIYETQQKHGTDSVFVMATTGRAASLLPNGCTVHSHKFGLSLPVDKLYKEIKGMRLKEIQKRFKNLKLIIIDEFSMLKQHELHFVNKRLQEAMGNDYFMGGIVVLLSGDPGQLLPVGGKPIWDIREGEKHDLEYEGAKVYLKVLIFYDFL